MIRHIVLFELNDQLGDEKAQHLQALKADFEKLPDTISELKELKIELNVNPGETYDLALIALCEDLETLHAYAVHPDHVALVARYIKPYLVSRACVDHEA